MDGLPTEITKIENNATLYVANGNKSGYLIVQNYTDNNITDETCSNYQALGHDVGLECSKDLICKDLSLIHI